MRSSLRLVLLAILLGWPSLVSAQEITEVNRLRVQIQDLAEQLWQRDLELAQCVAVAANWRSQAESASLTERGEALKAQRRELEATIKAALGAKDGDKLDWATLTLKKGE